MKKMLMFAALGYAGGSAIKGLKVDSLKPSRENLIGAAAGAVLGKLL